MDFANFRCHSERVTDDETPDNGFGWWLRKTRESRGLRSIASAAKETGVPKVSWENYERGYKFVTGKGRQRAGTPQAATVKKIAAALQVSAVEGLEAAGLDPHEHMSPDEVVEDLAKARLQPSDLDPLLERLTPAQLAAVRDLLAAFAEERRPAGVVPGGGFAEGSRITKRGRVGQGRMTSGEDTRAPRSRRGAPADDR